jgi:hypothetical protein
MGSSGRAVNPAEMGPSRTYENLVSESCKADIGRELGRRLVSLPSAIPLVEFLVPGPLIGAEFDTIAVDALGDDNEPLSTPLGVQAWVVVRSYDRWDATFTAKTQLVRGGSSAGTRFEVHEAGTCTHIGGDPS